MAITQNALTFAEDTVDRTSYETASISPASNNLILAAVGYIKTGGGPAPTLSGNGLTWVEIGAVLSGTHYGISLFRAMGSSPSSGVVTISFGTATQDGAGWSIAEYANVDTSGANGSGAIVQSATEDTSSGDNISVTLGGFSSVDNATYGTFQGGKGGSWTFDAGSGFSNIHELGNGADGTERMVSEWRDDNDTDVDTFTSDSGSLGHGAGIAVEIKFAVAVTSTNFFQMF